jgi:hypothetical protein
MKREMSVVLLVAMGACGAGGFRGDVCRLPTTALVALPPASAPRTRNIVLVTIDGVRWQEIFGGVDRARADLSCGEIEALLPNLTALMRAGVAVGAPGGAEMVSSGPNFVSLPGYREIITGRTSRCTSNECWHIREPTLLDELRDGLQLRPEEIAVVASWERIARTAVRNERNATVSAGRHRGAGRERLRVNARAAQVMEEAEGAAAYPGYFDYRPDRYTAFLAREYLRERRPRFLWVALGDTDEYAHRNDYSGYLDALRSADRFVGELWATLGELGEYGAETTIVVTADHGRANDFVSHGGGAPESSRVWLVAAGGAVAPQGRVAAARKVHLADIAPTARALLGLPPDVAANRGLPIAEIAGPPSTVVAFDETVTRASRPTAAEGR